MVRKSRLQLMIALVMLGLAAALLLTGLRYLGILGGVEERPTVTGPAEPATGMVVVAIRTFSRGQALTREGLAVMRFDGTVPPNTYGRVEMVVGRVAVSDIHPNQVVVAEAVTAQAAAAGLAVLIPAGMRAVAIRVSDEIAVANFLVPGDWADLHVILPDRLLDMRRPVAASADGQDDTEVHILLQNVRVLTVGPAMSEAAEPAKNEREGQRRREVRDVTLAVTPEQASQIALMRTVASYALSLRNPTDHSPVGDHTVTVPDLRGADALATPQPLAAAAPAAAPPRRAPRHIDVLRGTQRDSLVLGQDDSRL